MLVEIENSNCTLAAPTTPSGAWFWCKLSGGVFGADTPPSGGMGSWSWGQSRLSWEAVAFSRPGPGVRHLSPW